MTETDWLAERFEENRDRLRGVAYRMLGSLGDADDAVQESWIRLGGVDADKIENLAGWLTTVVARVCLDMLRSRKSRQEAPFDADTSEPIARNGRGSDPEREALLADAVGLALMVVLDTLTPAERLAFVLHELFGASFDEIGATIGRSPAAARQLASRARRRVQGTPKTSAADLASQRGIVDAFLAALRAGDVEGLLAVLDPDVLVRTDIAGGSPDGPREVRGARTWATGAVTAARGARFAQPALVNGVVGIVVAPKGRLFRVLSFTIIRGRITQIEVIGDPERLGHLDLAVLTQA